jgi:4-carboxymuconolactone decarboxylase
MNDEQRYQQGITVRTEVLGEKHVGRSLENLNDFNADFQNFISRFAGAKSGHDQACRAIPVA